MRSPPAIREFERRLTELGCPPAQVRRHVREMADHLDDLRQAALEEGLAEADAEARANQLLGEPAALAESLAAVLRHSSWFGRHRVLGFCLLPPLGIFATSLLGLAVALGLLRCYFSGDEWRLFADEGAALNPISLGVRISCYAAIALMTLAFCWLARRSAAGIGWALAACGACSLQSLFTFCSIIPHSATVGYSSSPNWAGALVPLLVGAAILAWHRRLRAQLSPAGCLTIGGTAPGFACSRGISRATVSTRPVTHFFGSPTYWTVAGLVAGLTWLALHIRADFLNAVAQQKARQELRTHTWPAERAAVVANLRARGARADLPEAKTVDLRPWVNAPLPGLEMSSAKPGSMRADPAGNNLQPFPRGVHLFAGVPFQVNGKIQLMGRGLIKLGEPFPTRARGIPFQQKCRRLFLLHGACYVSPAAVSNRAQVATLVLHYADGSEWQLPIVAGRHLLDDCGPIMKSGVLDIERSPKAPGTELAWSGTDPILQKTHPDDSLRIYKTVFDNPLPEVEIASIDYLSTLSESAPFLLGVTLE